MWDTSAIVDPDPVSGSGCDNYELGVLSGDQGSTNAVTLEILEEWKGMS